MEEYPSADFSIRFKTPWPTNFPAQINDVICDRESITLLVYENKGAALRHPPPETSGIACISSSTHSGAACQAFSETTVATVPAKLCFVACVRVSFTV